MNLDPGVIEGLTIGLLAAKYDNPCPIPDLHRELWAEFCSDDEKVASAAPREHAKSTAITHAGTLAAVLFREKSFVLLVSDTESQAAEFLGDIKAELVENTALKKTFGIKKILKDTETNIVVQFKDGEMFRIVAKGSMQKVRGLKWRGKRPDLIVGDDLENDEIVMNAERREKFRRWFFNALVPCGSDTCSIRIVGTILHLDSLLNRLMSNKKWRTRLYEACDENFENLLWSEKFSEKRLRDIYEDFAEDGNTEGFSQEYRNHPVDIKTLFFKKDYFLDFPRDKEGVSQLPNLEYFAGADFAVSEKEKADFTVFVVVGVCPEGKLYIVDVRRFKGPDHVDELIATQKMWDINMWMFESGQISKSIEPLLITEMRRKRTILNYDTHTPTQSKTARARSIQGYHKSGFISYDKEKEWWPPFEAELSMVADSGPRGRHDDQFDAFAYVGMAVDQFWEAQSDEELEDEAYEEELFDFSDMGRCASTGY